MPLRKWNSFSYSADIVEKCTLRVDGCIEHDAVARAVEVLYAVVPGGKPGAFLITLKVRVIVEMPRDGYIILALQTNWCCVCQGDNHHKIVCCFLYGFRDRQSV